MAGYRGHLTGALVFFGLYLLGLIYLYSIDAAYQQFTALELVAYPLALLGVCLLFGLWPDVDINSRAQVLFYSIFFVIDLFLIATQHVEAAAYLGLFALLPVLSKHRGWTHTWGAMLLIPLPLLVLPLLFYTERPLAGLPFYGAAVIGYGSHLFMDGLLPRRERPPRS